jgi:sterol O-acyltransferase
MTELDAIASLLIPFTVGYMILFYMVFDVACNGFAELTRFADREFYSDWWNRFV